MPKGFTEHEKELIRKRLLKEGYKQFSAYGLKKTNIEELAQRSKISKGAFYLFYESKEALFMDVAELAEQNYRQEVLAAINQPGPSPRARLLTVLKTAFALLKTMPILQLFTSSDYDLLFRRVPAEKLEEHLASDQIFFAELVTRCQNAGIPICVQPEEISRLLYPLVLAIMHEDDLGQENIGGSVELLLELIAAFCVGEVEIEPRMSDSSTLDLEDGGSR
jgi:AcrR family transcriptional regulator